MSTRSILKSFGIVSFFTLVSRLFGLVRDIVSASLFGTTLVWDSFLISFMVPNLFRRLLGEGALSSSFIPVFVDTLKKDGKTGAWELVNIVFTILLITTTLLVVGGIFILRYGEGFLDVGEKGALVLSLMQVLLPYLIFINLTALLIAALNSLGVFGVPALSPVILNVVWISSIFLICPRMGWDLGSQAHGLAYALLGAGIIQLGFQFCALWRKGWRFRLQLGIKNPRVRSILGLMGPAAIGLMLHQLNVTVDLALGYSLGDGAVSSLWYGSRLMQFPLALFGIALGTVVFPAFSGQTASNDMKKLKETLSFSLRTLLLIMIPASVGLMVLRYPIVRLLFERNQFDAASTTRAATTLAFYCLGLFAYASAKVLVPCFYSLKDMRTPVRIVAAAVGVNFVLNLILMRTLQEGGLALATSIAGIFEFGLLLYWLRRKIGELDGLKIFASAIKALLASLVMGVLTVQIFNWVLWNWPWLGFSLKAALALVPLGLGALIYGALAWMLCFDEVREILRKVRGGKKSRSREEGKRA